MLQAANKSSNDAKDREDHKADHIADGPSRKLSDNLAAAKNQHSYSHELLKRLGNVDEVARLPAKDTEESVTVAQNRISGRVKAQVNFPQDPTTCSSGNREYNVEGNTGSVTNRGKRVPGFGSA